MVGYALMATVLASETVPGEPVPRDPNSAGWDLRCLGACGVQRDGAAFHYTTSGGTVFLEYHGLVIAERKDPQGSVTLLQEEGQMTATWSDGTVVQRPEGPQVKLLVDPRLPDEEAQALEARAKVVRFERGEAPALSTTEVRHRPGFSALAEGLAERSLNLAFDVKAQLTDAIRGEFKDLDKVAAAHTPHDASAKDCARDTIAGASR